LSVSRHWDAKPPLLVFDEMPAALGSRLVYFTMVTTKQAQTSWNDAE